MQSSGGMATVESAAQRPVNLLMSGPVAGLIGGIWAGRVAGFDNVVTLDIGGTSADIGVAAGGELRMRHLLDTKIGDYQAMVPMVDIDTIGAGGGSIAVVDEGGVFRVGPQSAGADPGPACYGRGGELPTSTDAQLLLGRLRPDRGLLGGRMLLDVELAETAMQPVADGLGMTVEEAALGALQIQKYGMTQAIELNSVRRGYDPREFTLVAAGGAGPLFACDIARELEIARVLVPPHPGIIAATGLLATDLQHEFVATERHALKSLDARTARARASTSSRRRRSRSSTPTAWRTTAGSCGGSRTAATPGRATRCAPRCRRAASTRAGSRSCRSASTPRTRPSTATASTRRSRSSTSGSSRSGASTSCSRRSSSAATAIRRARGRSSARSCSTSTGRAERHPTPFYERELLRAGDRFEGPAIVEQYDTTTVIPPGLAAEIDAHGNIVIDCTVAAASAEERAARRSRRRS